MAQRGKFSGRISDMRIFDLIVQCRRSRDEAAWEDLRSLVERDVDAFCEGTDTRWLVSVCDTYADYGEPLERLAAMLIVLLVNWEKMARTQRLLCDEGPPVPPDEVQWRAPLWDGVTPLHLVSRTYDMPRNLFKRLVRVLAPVPHLQRIFREVAGRLLDAGCSTPALLDAASVHRELRADLHKALRGDTRRRRKLEEASQ